MNPSVTKVFLGRMQCFNISYNDPGIRRQVDALCGLPYGLWKRIRMGGTGSPRMLLLDMPQELHAMIHREEDLGSFSLELRTKGLLLRGRSILETLGIPLPWSLLQGVVLGSPATGTHAPLLLLTVEGHHILLAVHREHWGAVQRLVALHAPSGIFRTVAKGFEMDGRTFVGS